jgi:hypothetical protein
MADTIEQTEQTVLYKLRQVSIRSRIEMLENAIKRMAEQETETDPKGHFAGYLEGAKLYAECEAQYLRALLDNQPENNREQV